MENLRDLLKEFYPFARKRFGFDKNAKIIFLEDEDNASNPLGKTAFYNPGDYTVSVYVTGRHPKDILRSVSHELVHHTQNCRGEFTNTENMGGQGYAQKDEHLREMEREAYEQGNLCFRDWEDMRKNNLDTNYVNEDGNMSNKDLRNNRLNSHIMEKWGFSSKQEETEEQVKEENGYDDDYELSDLEADFPDIFKGSDVDAEASADAEKDAGDEFADKEEDELEEGTKVYVIATENCGEEATVLEMLDDATAKIQIGDKKLVIRQDYLEKIKLDEAAKPDFLDLDKDGDKEEPMKSAAEDAEEDEDEDKKVEEGVIDWIKDKLGMGLKGKRDIEYHDTPGLAAVHYGKDAHPAANKFIKRFIELEIKNQEEYQEKHRKDPKGSSDKTKRLNQKYLEELYEYRDSYKKFREIIMNLGEDIANDMDIIPWLKYKEEEQVDQQIAYLKEKYLEPLDNALSRLLNPTGMLPDVNIPDRSGSTKRGKPIPLIKGKLANELQFAHNQLKLDITILEYMKRNTPWGSFDSSDSRRKGVKSDIASGSDMYGNTLNVGMNEEMEIGDPTIEMTPEVLDQITARGAVLNLADDGATATKQDDNVWEISGNSGDLKDGEVVMTRSVIRNLSSSMDETVEEISSCAGGAVEGAPMASKDDDEDELEEAGRPHSMRYGRKMSDLDADAKTRETDFLKKKEDEKEDEDEDEKLEESFSIKSAASNRNKLMAEQVMKAWFNK